MLMRTSTHHKMVEADTVKIAEQGSLIRKLTAERDKVFAANLKLALDLEEVRSRLGKFTGPRQRGPGGRFLPVKSVLDYMIEELERAA